MRNVLTPEAVTLRDAGWTLDAIGAKFGVCRTAVSNYLKRRRAGKRINQPPVVVTCANCGASVTRVACLLKTTIRPCCSRACYLALVQQNNYRKNRHGQRVGRAVVASLYGPLPPRSVVHHRDGNNRNNAPANLVLFASQADHMRFHRHGRTVILWTADPLFSSENP